MKWSNFLCDDIYIDLLKIILIKISLGEFNIKYNDI